MSIDYEAEYNNSRRVPEIASIAPRWAEASAALRASERCDLDIPYGPDPRHTYDLFHPTHAAAGAPMAVYIHGGYWQGRAPKDFSCVAAGLLAHGVAVAMPAYRLCPTVRIADICDDLRSCLAALWVRSGRRAVVTGHSAGGHLTAALLATDWSNSPGVPEDLVRAGYSISGVFDVAPLVGTSIGVALHETVASSRAISPILWPAPPKSRWLTAAVGSDESPEFIRQSVALTRAWSDQGVKAECVLVPGANHFTVIDDLARPDSAMVHRIVTLAQLCAASSAPA